MTERVVEYIQSTLPTWATTWTDRDLMKHLFQEVFPQYSQKTIMPLELEDTWLVVSRYDHFLNLWADASDRANRAHALWCHQREYPHSRNVYLTRNNYHKVGVEWEAWSDRFLGKGWWHWQFRTDLNTIFPTLHPDRSQMSFALFTNDEGVDEEYQLDDEP